MERRFILFFVLSFLLIQLSMWWSAPPQQDKVADKAAAEAGADPDEAAAEDADAAAGEVAEGVVAAADAEGEAAADAAADPVAQPADDVADAEEKQPLTFATLGSIAADSPYRMAVEFTSQGAGVQRIELSDPRYIDVVDRGGYLGHLELADDGGKGLLVQLVGPGTPAAAAGVKVGDRMLEAGVDKPAPVKTAAELSKLLAKAKPKDKLKLVVERDGKNATLTADLRRRPLEVIRPEAENVLLWHKKLPDEFKDVPSFLLTLDKVDKKKVAAKADELPGVDLRTANWRLLPANPNEADTVVFERRVPKLNLLVTKKYQLAKRPANAASDAATPAYHLTLEVTVENLVQGAARDVAYRLEGPNGLPIEGWWYATKISRDWGSSGIRDVIGRYVDSDAKQQSAASIAEGDVKDFEGDAPMAYMGVDARYFSVALIPQTKRPEDSWTALVRPIVVDNKVVLRKGERTYANVSFRLISKPLSLAAGKSESHKYVVFSGPKRPELLAKYTFGDMPLYSLDDYVYYGWFGPVARAMVGLLHFFYSIVGNYGLAIIMLTVLVRGAMFPLSRGQAKSMARMQLLKPEMDRIKEKYKGDQQKQAQAMQQLYRKHNVNPLAGCMPMLIQLPVFIGLYRGLAVDVELRGAPLISDAFRWCSDLAAPDMLYDWSGWMPNLVTGTLGPYLNVLPLVTIVLFLLQQKMFMPEPTNDQAALQQKIMKYMMVLMGFLFYKVPSGLCIYFIASSLWGIAERKLLPMPTASLDADGTTGTSTARSSNSRKPDAGGDKRYGKNGHSGAKPGTKSKRR